MNAVPAPAARAGARSSLLPFFLPASGGQRFCLLHMPPSGRPPRGGIVYLHPLAEEMNKSRHVAAAQARAFARAGYSVLQIDLYGCGDSSGDFADARWAIWRNDVHLACAWLAPRVDGPLTLWGLRLGALLALDLAQAPPVPLERLLLWQPELDGRRCLDRFLRLHLAAQMLRGGAGSVSELRAALAAGQPVEVAGYCLSAALARELDAVAPGPPSVPAYWLQYAPAGQLPARAAQQAARWRDAGAAIHLDSFGDGAFWQGEQPDSQPGGQLSSEAGSELAACPQLHAATATLCADWLAASLPARPADGR